MSLVNMLLADAGDDGFSKGGPGSGPQGGKSEEKDHANFMSRKANAASRRANRDSTKNNHTLASQAHNEAFKSSNKVARLTGNQSFKDRALEHQSSAAYHAQQANKL